MSSTSFPSPSRISQLELKVFACSLMLVDHIGIVFFPNLVIFRIIGRLAFPIFAWFFAYGYARTRNWKKYLLRLLLGGLVAQPFYSLMFDKPFYDGLNILLTFSFNLVLFKFAHKFSRKKPLILLLGMVFETFLNFEYGWYSTASILLMLTWLHNKDIKDYVSWLLAWWVLNLASITISWYQPIAGFSSLILDATNTTSNKPSKFQTIAFYLFYPLHIVILLKLKGSL